MYILKVLELRDDFIVSIVISLVFFIVVRFFNLSFVFYNIYDNLGVIITIGITIASYLITSLMILLVFPENSGIRFIKNHPTYKYIFNAFVFSIILFVSMSILGFILKILIPFKSPYFLFPLIVIFILSIVSLFRCIWILKRMTDIFINQVRKNRKS